MKRASIACAFVLALASNAFAANVYVCSTGGLDSRSLATAANSATPLATLCRAVNGAANDCASASANAGLAVTADDTVTVCASDTQSAAGRNARLNPAFNPVNQGTSGHPITIQCATRGTCNLTLSSGAGPVIGANDRDYITWDGFRIRGATAPTYGDTGLVDIYLSTGVIVKYLDIAGDPNYEDPNDLGHGCSPPSAPEGCGNHQLIRCEKGTSITIQDNTLGANPQNFINTQNAGSTEFYDCDTVTVEHNDFSEAGSCVFMKGDQDGDGINQKTFIVRYNKCQNVGNTGVDSPAAGIMALTVQGAQVYGNLVTCRAGALFATQGITIFGFGASPGMPNPPNTHPAGPDDVDVVNNDIDGCDIGLNYDNGDACATIYYDGIRFYNNIVLNGRDANGSTNCSAPGTVPTAVEAEHNIYYNFSSNLANFNGTTRTLATWKSVWGLDTVSPAGSSTNPQMTSAVDYHPLAAYVATQGIDILNLAGGGTSAAIPAGIYVTGAEVVGVRPSGTAATGGGARTRGRF